MTLQKYEIKDGYIFYKDESSNMSAEISGLDHEGSGDFTQMIFTLSTATKARRSQFYLCMLFPISLTQKPI